jgi:hypothetical protein
MKMASVGVVTGRFYTADDSIAPLSQRQLQSLRNLGVTSIRIEFEDKQGARVNYVNAYKGVIKAAGALGISVIGVLSMNSVAEGKRPADTDNLADFDVSYAKAMFFPSFEWHDATYKNVDGSGFGVEAWEIWNEPDVYDFTRRSTGRFMGEEFALLCVRVFEEFKDRVGGRKIILGGISRMDDDGVLRAVFDSTPMRNFKAVNNGQLPCHKLAIHGYGNTQWPSRHGYAYLGGTFDDQIGHFLRLTGSSGGPTLIPAGQRIYLTEIGTGPKHRAVKNAAGDWEPVWNEVEYIRQASVAAEARWVFDRLAANPQFERAYWYNFRDDEDTSRSDPRGPQWYGIRAVPQSACGNFGIKLVHNALANVSGKPGVGQRQRWQILRAGDENWTEGVIPTPSCAPLTGADKILEAFNRNDGPQNLLGFPADRGLGGGPWVHQWNNSWLQDFRGALYSAGSDAMIVAENNASTAAVVYGRFWDTWMAHGGLDIGLPFDNGGGADRHPWFSAGTPPESNGWVQDLRIGGTGHNAMLTYETSAGAINEVFIIRQPILGKYFEAGGVGGLGYPRGNQFQEGGHVRQNFKKGYLTYP